ncbi:hypothetical protein V2J09_018379 [Rumex salicifolius]
MVLISATSLWFLSEYGGYKPPVIHRKCALPSRCNPLFLAKSAAILNRPLPPIPDLEISYSSAEEVAVRINHVLSVASKIAVHGILRVLLSF